MNALRIPLRALLILALFGVRALASAQPDVLVFTGGITSLTGGGPIYNGQYVLKQTDFGFLWLDTVAMKGGHVQVEAKCFVGQPPPVTNLYVIGDCNGITDILSTGSVVLARQLGGQCGAARRGCDGPRDDGHVYFVFNLGTWTLLTDNGTGTEAGISTQTADPQGRTWTVIQKDLARFAWHVVGGPAGEFFTVQPCRLADTRGPFGNYGGPSLSGGDDRSFIVWGQCGIPPGATAVAFNFTVTNAEAGGDLRVFPAGIPVPTVSTLNWQAGQTRSGNGIVPLGGQGAVTVHLDQDSVTTSDVIIDVAGWFD